MNRTQDLKKNLENVQAQIGNKAELIVVSKTFPASDIEILYQLGQRNFGENKVQELLDKSKELALKCPEIRWHMIGHLQSNKINTMIKVNNLYAIHSIDSIQLLNRLLPKLHDKPLLFLEVNTSGEEEKSGFETLDELKAAISLIHESNHILHGLMTIGSIRASDFKQAARDSFEKLSQLKKSLNSSLKLSMGMSSDYELALEYGANYLRIGSKILGRRENT